MLVDVIMGQYDSNVDERSWGGFEYSCLITDNKPVMRGSIYTVVYMSIQSLKILWNLNL
jgi:hypothetical protein